MSGLDGLGWPNPEDEPKPKKTMNSQLEIKLAPTPETDVMPMPLLCSRRFRCANCGEKCRSSKADRGERIYCRPCESLIEKCYGK